MKPIPAIVEKLVVSAADIDLARERVIVDLAGERDDIRIAERHEQQAAAARESAKARRLRIGAQLCKVRPAWPERGPKAKGWGEFLASVKLDDSTALRYMNEYRDPTGFAQQQRKLSETAGDDGPEGERSELAQGGAPQLALVPDPAPEVDIDRDTWCTPAWITSAIGRFGLDPCSNERSTVAADLALQLDRGQDGLVGALHIRPEERVFINPPYSDVAPWIRAYAHTRFCFLLKLDTSTRWFAELHPQTELILIPRKRVQFEPPPGVPPERAIAQQFPHALFYAHAEDATDAIHALCWQWRTHLT